MPRPWACSSAASFGPMRSCRCRSAILPIKSAPGSRYRPLSSGGPSLRRSQLRPGALPLSWGADFCSAWAKPAHILTCAKVASVWFPRSERGLASALSDSGSRIGSVLAIPLVSWIISTLGWRESFVITGLLGFVWAAFWIWLYRDPEHYPSVTPEQLARLQPERGPAKSAEAPKVPWLSLFRYRAIWGMMIGFFCLNFVIFFFITWFPTYLVQARGFSLKELGTLGILPALVALLGGGIGGYVSDSPYRRGWSLTKARKTCLVGGMLMSSVITFSAFAPNAYVALVFAIAYASLAFTAAAIWSLPGDV